MTIKLKIAESGNPAESGHTPAMAELARERDDLARQLEELAREADAHRSRVAALVGVVEQKEDLLVHLREELRRKTEALAKREDELGAARALAIEEARGAQDLRQSFSYRITAPLRRVRGFVLERERLRRFLAVQDTGVVDPEWYLARNPDVASAGMDPVEHYERYGKKEGRAPSPAAASRAHGGFDRHDYADWIKRYDTLSEEDRLILKRRGAALTIRPRFSVVIPTYNPRPEWLAEAIDSVRGQLYDHWELCIADDASTDPRVRSTLERFMAEDPRIKVVFRPENGHISRSSNSALELATGDFVVLLDHDDLLPEHALFWIADAINAVPTAQILYSDEDKIDARGVRSAHYFKPDFNRDLFYSQNMISHLGVYRTALVREVGGFRQGFEGSQDYDLALRCLERVDESDVVHVPRVLYHWRIHAESTAHDAGAKPYAVIAGARALNEHFARTGRDARAEIIDDINMYRVRYTLPEPRPLVSIVIPTRNAVRLVRQCVESIVAKTTYEPYEILLVDNGSDEPESLAYFEALAREPNTRVLRDEGPFNFSALNNAAVRVAHGAYVLLLNNDIEVVSPEWLEEMVGLASQPGVGAVGARLWYPGDTLQHGGVVLGVGGVASHSHKHVPKGNAGYFGRGTLLQSFSAVTAACLLVKKEIYEQVGGLDERALKIAFNDVDFCLRVKAAGYRNVWTPYAELYHHESATRGVEDNPEKVARFESEIAFMRERYGASLLADPAYNPNLTLSYDDFGLAWPPRDLGVRR